MVVTSLKKSFTRPLLKMKGFSTLHLEIFEQILLTEKTNRVLNRNYGYSLGSHQVVDHYRTVMYKLLALESLCKASYKDQVIHPRRNKFWWIKLLDKHKSTLITKALAPKFYESMVQ